MEAYAIVEHGKPLQRLESETPTPVGKQVLVAVTHAGVCHSDLHLIEGSYDLGSKGMLDLAKRGLVLPMTPGHEIVGKIVSWGPDADESQLEVGATRLVFPWIGCGHCKRCQADEQNLCLATKPIGMAVDGGYASHVLVPEAKFLLDIEGIDPGLACTYACSGVTCYSAIQKLLPLDPEETVVVIGAGGLGLNAVSILAGMDHRLICVVDTSSEKLDAAKAQGASSTVLAGSDGGATSAAILEACGGTAFAIVDTVNGSATAQFAFDALSKGGRLIQVGLFGGELKVPLPLMPAKAATLRGSYVGSLVELRAIVELAKAGKLAPIPTEERALDQANAALDDLRAGRVTGRIILTNDQPPA